MAYYLDTSALVKRYVREQGTGWVIGLLRHSDVYIARITGPELVAALSRKVRTGELAAAEELRARHAFRQHWQRRYNIVEVVAAVVDLAMDLAVVHGLRGYDAVHLAAALTVEEVRRAVGLASLTFVSADTHQREAARSAGLLVDDPNAYA